MSLIDSCQPLAHPSLMTRFLRHILVKRMTYPRVKSLLLKWTPSFQHFPPKEEQQQQLKSQLPSVTLLRQDREWEEPTSQYKAGKNYVSQKGPLSFPEPRDPWVGLRVVVRNNNYYNNKHNIQIQPPQQQQQYPNMSKML